MANYNRRQFITRSTLGFAGASLGLSVLGQGTAQAANVGGYKALVGIMLKGGMDQNDTILPVDAPSYDALKAVRPGIFSDYDSDSEDSSRNRENLLALNPSNASRFMGRQFGLPRELSNIHGLFETGDAAIVGNVGPLLEPVTRDHFESGIALLPKRIFSHNDQQSSWMALDTEGVRKGWGGQFADAVLTSDSTANPLYAAITATSPDVFLAGERARAFRVPEIGRQISLDPDRVRSYLGWGDDSDAARAKLSAYMRKTAFDHDNLFRKDVIGMAGRGIDNQLGFSERVAAASPLATVFPNTRIGRQLGSVAQAMSLRTELGVSRQVFYSAVGGYDTHDNQANDIPRLHTELDEAVAAFQAAMLELGLWNDVLLFTMSDFGRSMVDNGDGCDHGWGGHHFVMGGSVRGQQIYGDMPEIDAAHPQYTGTRMRLIPTTSVEQHAAALGGWFGLDAGELANVFPNLDRFDRSALDFV
ncbi:MAG: DUF1501 domain-containing protein [Litorimonas sp.]